MHKKLVFSLFTFVFGVLFLMTHLFSNQALGASFMGLGDLPGFEIDSTAFAVSADGKTVVGDGNIMTVEEAFRWTQSSGMVALGDLDGGTYNSTAMGVSKDGSIVVGCSNSASGGEAYRWTESGGMVGLGDLPEGPFLV